MSFIFSQVNPSKYGENATPFTTMEFAEAALDQGIYYTAYQSIYRMSEYYLAGDEDPVLNPLIPAAEANHAAQQEGLDLKFDIDVTMDEYNLMVKRKIAERDRNTILQTAEGALDTAGMIGVGFLGSLLNPLDAALNFVPIVGSSARAANLAKVGTIGARVGGILERGVVTSEQLNAARLAMKGYTAAIIEGSVGQAITEIPLIFSLRQDQIKYGADDFFTNVALGGAFGAGVNSIRLGLRSLKIRHQNLTPETRENMAGAAMEDFVNGREVDPARLVHLDDSLITNDRLLWHAGNGKGIEEHTGPIWFHGSKELHLESGSDRDFYVTVKGKEVDALVDPYDGLALNAGFFYGYKDSALITDIHNYILKHTGEEDLTFTKEGKFDNGDEAADQASELHITLQEKTLENPEIGKELTSIFLAFKSRDPEGFEKLMDETSFMVVDRQDLPVNSEGKIDLEEVNTAGKSAGKRAKQKLADYKAHEETKIKNREKLRDTEIEESRTVEKPEQYRYTGRSEDIDAELKRMDAELEELYAELGPDAHAELGPDAHAGEFELDPRLSGDTPRGPTKADIAILHNRWKAFLPEQEGVANPTYKADDVAYAAQQFTPEYRALFDELFELDPTLRDVPIDFDPNLYSTHNASGMYRGSIDRIELAMNDTPTSTVLHELVHASVVRRMRSDMDKAGELKMLVHEGKSYIAGLRRYAALTENKGMKNMVEAYISTVEHHSKQQGLTGQSDILNNVNTRNFEDFSFLVNEPQYGLLNLDEFIAEGLSNRQFQLYLNEIKVGRETLLTKFINTVKEVFSINTKSDSALAQLLDGYEQVIQTGKRSEDGFFANLPRATSNDISKTVLDRASNCLL